MKRIVFFTPSLNIGGVERVFLTYADALIRLGYDVSYLVCKKESNQQMQLPEKLKIVSLGVKQLRSSIIPLIRFFKTNDVDVFITGGDVPNVLSILSNKLACSKAKVIISHHNYFNIERNALLSKIFFHLFYNRAHRVLSVSDGITNMLSNQGVSKRKLATLYNPVDLNSILDLGNVDLNLRLPANFLLFLGRLGEVKNLPFLFDSFALLTHELPSIELVLVGDGPMKTLLVEKAEALKLNEKIHFLGVLPNPFPVMKAASAVILPSFSEALPTIILESFAFHKTVIATPTNGAKDLLENGELGYLSHSFDNLTEFAELIKRGLSNPISSEKLSQKVSTFNVDSKVKELEKLF